MVIYIMEKDIFIPPIGESITEAIIGNILKKENSMVNSGDEIVELETDKANQLLYASHDGIIKWKVVEGDVVNVNQIIGTIKVKKVVKTTTTKEKAITNKNKENKTLDNGKKIRRNIEDFVKNLQDDNRVVQKPTLDNISKENNHMETRKYMSKIRTITASKMLQAKLSTAMLTTFNEIDMSSIIMIRKQYREIFEKKYEVKLGFLSFFVKAVISALKIFTDVNAYIEGEEIVYRHYYNINVAVNTEKGLIVPVIKHADKMSIADIEKKILILAESARNGTISISDLENGVFTISNGGVFGSLMSTPILIPGQSGILGIHKIEDRPIVVEGNVEIRPMMYVALTYDHRIVDGKGAVSFLLHIKQLIENPIRLLLKI